MPTEDELAASSPRSGEPEAYAINLEKLLIHGESPSQLPAKIALYPLPSGRETRAVFLAAYACRQLNWKDNDFLSCSFTAYKGFQCLNIEQ